MFNVIKQKIGNKIFMFYYSHFEFDRVAEKKVMKSINLWRKGDFFSQLKARYLWSRIRKNYNCSIFPGITVGDNLRIEHASGITIGQTAVIGNSVRLYQGVDVIAKVTGDAERNKNGERRHAIIGNIVILGSGCTIIGSVTIGDNSIIGARAIVTHDVPPNSVVIGTNGIREKRENEIAPEYIKV